jgi:ssDNA-binding replication factor A large subunit
LTSLQEVFEDCIAVDAVEVVRSKDCKHRGEKGGCPMYFVDEIEWDDDGYIEVDYVPHDYTVDDGFCDRGERRTNDQN